jgi:hypothetical protein
MMFPTDISILTDPNEWIGDTGATTHQTCHDVGLTNKKEAKDSDVIVMGNGANKKAAKMADLPGIVCDKEGHEKLSVIMEDITLLECGKFNLFSIPKTLMQGWKHVGDREKLWIYKGNAHLVFDIKIETPKGALYVVYIK